MIVFKFVGIIVVSLVIAFIVTYFYKRFLMLLSNWINKKYGDDIRGMYYKLFKKSFTYIGNQRGYQRQDSNNKIK